MFAWLRGMTKWILMNRNRRIVTIIAFLNVLLGYAALALFHEPRLNILMALVSAYAVSSLTMERYLTLGASCIAALQVLLFLLLEPALMAAPLTNAPLLLLITAALTLLMMSMITNIQQQEYFSTIESDRQLLYKATINALLSARASQHLQHGAQRCQRALRPFIRSFFAQCGGEDHFRLPHAGGAHYL